MRRFVVALAATALHVCLPPSFSVAQVQPTTAGNSQDETINILRNVDSGAESFRILRSGDKAELNRYVTRVYPLRNANPFELLPYLRSIASLEKGSVVTAMNPDPNGEIKAWVQVNVPDFQLPFIDSAVATYDVPEFASSQGDIKFSYRTRYRDATAVADFIRRTSLSGDGDILADASTNTIYVEDSPSDFRRVLSQIQFYDIPVPQLDVEVLIYELTEVDQTSLGLDWDAWKTALSGAATISTESSRSEVSGSPTVDVQNRGFEGLLSVDATAAARFLNFLVDRGKARIRATSNLTVTNNALSTLTSGTDVPVYTYTFSRDIGKSVLTRAATPVTGEGISLALVPRIALDAAYLDVALAMRSPAAIDKTGVPIYSEQEIQAELTLAQGQLYKIGGMRRSTQTIQRKGIPLLKDIPGLKPLFSNEARLIRETELYVFLRPRWSAPLIPTLASMQSDRVVMPVRVPDILQANPALSMSEEDARILDRYFSSVDNP